MATAKKFGTILFVALCLASGLASAERSNSFGEFQIHYNALRTDLIDPSVARAYGIIRSKNRALINVAVLRRVMGTAGQPARAKVTGTAVNLNAQLRNIDMRELNEGGAIYYIGEFPINHNETLNIKLDVLPEGESNAHTIEFSEQFFTE